MGLAHRRNIALAALTGVGAIVAANALMKPSKTQSIANGMRRQLDEYNTHVRPGQDPSADTLMDRKEIMTDVKSRKPWNITYAEREAMQQEEKKQ
ncbi:hypothetical protein B0J14DRAFT_70233 [Halenospora varia]|nr:hypothetical protein B0J14DRAFT_70233 [Halenospora varia]